MRNCNLKLKIFFFYLLDARDEAAVTVCDLDDLGDRENDGREMDARGLVLVLDAHELVGDSDDNLAAALRSSNLTHLTT